MKNKLTKQQVLTIPNLRKTKTKNEIAKLLNVHPSAIDYWVRRLRSAGHIVPPVYDHNGRKPIDLNK